MNELPFCFSHNATLAREGLRLIQSSLIFQREGLKYLSISLTMVNMKWDHLCHMQNFLFIIFYWIMFWWDVFVILLSFIFLYAFSFLWGFMIDARFMLTVFFALF